MNRTIEIPDDVYSRIEAEASATGATVAEWIAAHAPNGCAEPCSPAHTDGNAEQNAAGQDSTEAPVETRTLADRLAGRIGRLRSERGDLSERGSELFAEDLLAQQRAGRL